jgi:predicted phage tail protein
MHASDWIAIVACTLTMVGGGITGVSRLTRIAVAVETLAEAMRAVTARVEDHEKRLSKGGL